MQALFITHFANGTQLPPAMQYDTEKVSDAVLAQQAEGADFDDGPGSTPQVRTMLFVMSCLNSGLLYHAVRSCGQ